jgi:hypothetical protein
LYSHPCTFIKQTHSLYSHPCTFIKQTHTLYTHPCANIKKTQSNNSHPSAFNKQTHSLYTHPCTFIKKTHSLYSHPCAFIKKTQHPNLLCQLKLRILSATLSLTLQPWICKPVSTLQIITIIIHTRDDSWLTWILNSPYICPAIHHLSMVVFQVVTPC